jgi:hypothetical protein
VAQVVECQPRKCEALSSSPNTAKKTKKQKNIPLRFLQTEEHKRDPKNANIQTFCQTLNDLSKLSELNILPF